MRTRDYTSITRPFLALFGMWLAFGALLLGQTGSSDSRDAKLVRQLLHEHASAWAGGDPNAATSLMSDDADWVSDGVTVIGRKAIQESYVRELKNPSRPRYGSVSSMRIRFLRPDVCLVDGLLQQNSRRRPFAAILTKDAVRWEIRAYRLP